MRTIIGLGISHLDRSAMESHLYGTLFALSDEIAHFF
jgi:hypothetical protein